MLSTSQSRYFCRAINQQHARIQELADTKLVQIHKRLVVDQGTLGTEVVPLDHSSEGAVRKCNNQSGRDAAVDARSDSLSYAERAEAPARLLRRVL